jgi:hypothetical protein
VPARNWSSDRPGLAAVLEEGCHIRKRALEELVVDLDQKRGTLYQKTKFLLRSFEGVRAQKVNHLRSEKSRSAFPCSEGYFCGSFKGILQRDTQKGTTVTGSRSVRSGPDPFDQLPIGPTDCRSVRPAPDRSNWLPIDDDNG